MIPTLEELKDSARQLAALARYHLVNAEVSLEDRMQIEYLCGRIEEIAEEE